MKLYDCKKCGAKHGLELEDKVTGESEPLDICYSCMFSNIFPSLPKKIILINEDDQTMMTISGDE
jgi:hypothetical protein